MQLKPRYAFIAVGFLSCLTTPALAQEAGASASLSDVDAHADGGGSPGEDLFELGVFGGAMLMSERATAAAPGSPELDAFGLEGGLRVGIYPIDYMGLELEGAGILTGHSGDETSTIGAGRAHLVGQLPLGRVTPFLVVGGGFLGGECPADGCSGQFGGRELDGLFHFGAGVKVGLTDGLHVRLDLRDNIVDGDHLPEALLGLAFTFDVGGSEPAPAPEPMDSDGDGITDDVDECPNEPANTENGCPVPDTDGDGKADDVDQCPNEPSDREDGCPDPDPDGDGIIGDADKCPDVAGIAPDGCPDLDPDKDGIIGDADKCPNAPETVNGYEDTDGCPDEVPEKIQKFSGVIAGIQFDLGKATIRRASHPTLDEAVETLKEYPNLRLRISGHTDSTGSDQKNLDLSKARAQAVADYFVSKGIEAGRLETVGEGSATPIADNATAAGREQNRRIEFKVVQ